MVSLRANKPLFYSIVISGSVIASLASGLSPELSTYFELVELPTEVTIARLNNLLHSQTNGLHVCECRFSMLFTKYILADKRFTNSILPTKRFTNSVLSTKLSANSILSTKLSTNSILSTNYPPIVFCLLNYPPIVFCLLNYPPIVFCLLTIHQ